MPVSSAVTPLGIFTDARDVQPEKALSPMLTSPSGRVISVRDVQLLNACFPMEVTVLGMDTIARDWQLSNTPSAILVDENGGQLSTVVQEVVFQSRQACAELDRLQEPTGRKGGGADGGDRIGDHDLSELGVVERRGSDGEKPLGERHPLQSGAVFERVIVNAGHTLGNDNACQ